jgi:hypothetical protein
MIGKGLTSLTRELRKSLGRTADWAPPSAALPAAPQAPSASYLERPGQSKIGYLRAMDIFQDLGQEDMDWLERVTTMITAEKGQVVYMPGQTGEGLFLLKKGHV